MGSSDLITCWQWLLVALGVVWLLRRVGDGLNRIWNRLDLIRDQHLSLATWIIPPSPARVVVGVVVSLTATE